MPPHTEQILYNEILDPFLHISYFHIWSCFPQVQTLEGLANSPRAAIVTAHKIRQYLSLYTERHTSGPNSNTAYQSKPNMERVRQYGEQ